jgi:thioredoxin 1
LHAKDGNTGYLRLLFDFSPCKAIAPKLEEFSNELNAVFLKVDVDECSVSTFLISFRVCCVQTEVFQDVAEAYAIRAMPTFLLFKNGQKVAEVIGADANKLHAKIKELM